MKRQNRATVTAARLHLQTCILAGCDFVKALPGIGVRKAHAHIRRLRSFVKVAEHSSPPHKYAAQVLLKQPLCVLQFFGLGDATSWQVGEMLDYRQVARMLRYNGTSVPRDYEAQVQLAIWTFRHQLVFDPASRRLVHLNRLPQGGLAMDVAQLPPGTRVDPDRLDFLGPLLPDDVAASIAAGDLNPHTRQPYKQVMPVVCGQLATQLERGGGAGPAAGRRTGSAPAQRNSIKSYFAAMAAAAPMSAATGRMTADFKAPRRGSASGQPTARVGRQPRAAQLAALHARGYSSQPELSDSACRTCTHAKQTFPHQYFQAAT